MRTSHHRVVAFLRGCKMPKKSAATRKDPPSDPPVNSSLLSSFAFKGQVSTSTAAATSDQASSAELGAGCADVSLLQPGPKRQKNPDDVATEAHSSLSSSAVPLGSVTNSADKRQRRHRRGHVDVEYSDDEPVASGATAFELSGDHHQGPGCEPLPSSSASSSSAPPPASISLDSFYNSLDRPDAAVMAMRRRGAAATAASSSSSMPCAALPSGVGDSSIGAVLHVDDDDDESMYPPVEPYFASPKRKLPAKANKQGQDEGSAGDSAGGATNGGRARKAAAAGSSPSLSSSSAAAGSAPSRSSGKDVPVAPHPSWESHIAHIVAMRARRDAPVDSMGCERCGDPGAEPATQRFQTLVSLMLSSQTKDEVTHAACQRLIHAWNGPGQLRSMPEITATVAGLAAAASLPSSSSSASDTTAEASSHQQQQGASRYQGFTAAHIASAAVTEEQLATIIYPVGFYRNKARFLKAAAKMIVEEHSGDIPGDVKGLTSLPGVGPKMAFIAMAAAWGRPVGIGVDTHVHRIANRLGWVATKDPEGTREALQSWLPRKYWAGINILLVGFGQQRCTPLNPRCHDCLNKDVCPRIGVDDSSGSKTKGKGSNSASAPATASPMRSGVSMAGKGLGLGLGGLSAGRHRPSGGSAAAAAGGGGNGAAVGDIEQAV